MTERERKGGKKGRGFNKEIGTQFYNYRSRKK